MESVRAIRMMRTEKIDAKDALGCQGLTRHIQRIRVPPMISLPDSGIGSISVWLVLGVGLITGLLAGALGVGGGFIRMPMLVYMLGIPTHVAIGTDLFEIMISAGFGTITHAIKGNVDIMMALVMQTGAALGAQIGAVSTRFFAELTTLHDLGANEVIAEEYETSLEIFARVLAKYLVPKTEIDRLTAETRKGEYQMLRKPAQDPASLADLKLNFPDMEMSSIQVHQKAPVAGRSLAELQLRAKYGVTLLAIRRGA